ncbi:MAG: glycosyltransferase family 2 protein [Paludibacteraceae bacterium]|nr:glycosyltransferase family 2 protein [Paludibacteraceae bacterium]
MRLSVIIVSYNVKYYLEQCLSSVFASSMASDLEVFVVDNASSDGTVDYLRTRFPQVHYMINSKNLGFAVANNIAIRRCESDYVLLLNPDTVLGEQTLERVCSFLDAHPRAGAAGVKMIDAKGRFLPESKRGFPTMWVSFCKLSGLNRLFPKSRVFGRYHLRYLDPDSPHRVDVLAGAFMVLRRSVLDQIGLLDERFFMYGEDIDLSYRVSCNGDEVWYLPYRILHYKGESVHASDARYVRIFFRAMVLFYCKHFNGNVFGLLLVRLGMIMGMISLFFQRKFSQLFRRSTQELRTPVTYTYPEQTYEQILSEIERHRNQSAHSNFIFHSDTGISVGSGGDVRIE